MITSLWLQKMIHDPCEYELLEEKDWINIRVEIRYNEIGNQKLSFFKRLMSVFLYYTQERKCFNDVFASSFENKSKNELT